MATRDASESGRVGDPRSSQIALLYGHLASNHGDTAVTAGCIELLRTVRPGCRITIVAPRSGAASDAALRALEQQPGTAAVHPVDLGALRQGVDEAVGAALDPTSFEDLLDRTADALDLALPRDAPAVAFGGGEHLYSYGRWGDDVELLVRVLPLLHAHATGREVVFLPSTIGPLASDLSRRAIAEIHRVVKVLHLREPASYRHVERALRGEGVTEIKAKVGLDPAFFLPGTDAELNSVGSSHSPSIIAAPRLEGFGMRLDRFREESKATQQLARATTYRSSLAFDYYRRTLGEVVASHDALILVAQSEMDHELCRELADTVQRERQLQVSVVRPQSLHEQLRIFASSKVILTSRFHSMVFGSLLGIPTTAVVFAEHGHKTHGLAQMLGTPFRAVSPSMDPVELAELVSADLSEAHEPAELRKRLAGVRDLTIADVRAGWSSDD